MVNSPENDSLELLYRHGHNLPAREYVGNSEEDSKLLHSSCSEVTLRKQSVIGKNRKLFR